MSDSRTRLRTPGKATLGVVVGLALAEGAFHLRDHGAFPHLNTYVADPVLGVRLQPGATERVSFGGNPVTHVRINASGFRGADWPPPDGDEIVVIGDSQAFGLGVEENETFSAGLATALGKPVLNAAVPTWGPPEFEKIIDEITAKRPGKTVLYVVNLVNDLFEARRPNTERHVVLDGWAVRKETAPAGATSFPGRGWLFRDSHAVFALRQTLFRATLGTEGFAQRAVASEGGPHDLIDLSSALAAERERAREATEHEAQRLAIETRYAVLEETNADLRVKKLAYDALHLGQETGVYLASRASPGDIVIPQRGEELGPLAASVKYVREAAELRIVLEKRLREQAERTRDAASSREILQALDDRDGLEAKLRAIHAAPVGIARATLPIVGVLERARKLVASRGGRLAVVVLPIDLQVSPAEWAKYGAPVEDLSATRVLAADIVEEARRSGVVAVDAFDALVHASPGAFLKGDPHLSPKGHAAVAAALAEALRAPPLEVAAGSRLSLPIGRSRQPRPVEWATRGELAVKGSSAARCVTRRIREWVYARCTSSKTSTARAVRVLSGGHGDAWSVAENGVVTLIAPVVRGDDFVARFSWSDRSRRLVIPWPADVVEPEASFVPDDGPPDPAPEAPPAAGPLCACAKKVPWAAELTGETATNDSLEQVWNRSAVPAVWSCEKLLVARDDDCVRTFASDCAKMLECAAGVPARMPSCGAGRVNGGATLRCVAAPPPPTDVAMVVDTAKAKPFDAPAVDAVAKPLLESALAAADTCHLLGESAPTGWWNDLQLYDECTFTDALVEATVRTAKALESWAREQKTLPLALGAFTDEARLFGAWIEHAHPTRRSRGTLLNYQRLMQAWLAYRPEPRLEVDPPTARHDYYDKTPDASADYTARTFDAYTRRRKTQPFLPWRDGPYGPSVP